MKSYSIYLSINEIGVLQFDGVDYGTGLVTQPPETVHKLCSRSSAVYSPKFIIDWGECIDSTAKIAAVRESFEFIDRRMLPEVLDIPPSFLRGYDHGLLIQSRRLWYADLSTEAPEAIKAHYLMTRMKREAAREGKRSQFKAWNAERLSRYVEKVVDDIRPRRAASKRKLMTLLYSRKTLPALQGREELQRKIIEKHGIKVSHQVGFFLFVPSYACSPSGNVKRREVKGIEGIGALDLNKPGSYSIFNGAPVCPMIPRSIR
jgi:hypothetical protein